MRSPVTALLEQFKSLTPEEAKVFLDLVDPQPEQEAPAKRTRKKRASKSPRAESLSSAIASARSLLPETPKALPLITEEGGPKCGICGNVEGYTDHSRPSPNYHPFESSVSAGKISSRRGVAKSSVPTSEIPADGVGSAALAASGGD